MFKANKYLSIRSLVISFVVFVFTVFTLPALADENDSNATPCTPYYESMMNMMGMEEQESIVLTFDPNDYTFLVYDPCDNYHCIVPAMKNILGRDLTPSEIRTWHNPVTPEDLQTHDILIIGSNFYGNTDGLGANTLLAGITGRVILTGHDADAHYVYGLPGQQAAQTFLINAINYILNGAGTGMIALGDPTTGFSYLPKDQWGFSVAVIGGGGTEIVTEFTPDGNASGVYNGLNPNSEPNSMSYDGSWHDKFTINQGSTFFVPFELGGSNNNDIITVAQINTAPPLAIYKIDDANASGVQPNDRITYTIFYSYRNNNPNYTEPLYNVVLTDYLPNEIIHNSVSDVNVSSGGSYSLQTNTVTWNLGTLNCGSSGSVTLAVTVGNPAASSWLLNKVKITADEANETTYTRQTPWRNVHNVTKNLWYNVIQSAIDTNTTDNDVIVVYPGTYTENIDFGSKQLILQSSNPAAPSIVAQTIINGSGSGSDNNTVTFSDNNSTLNGFTVTGGFYGVYCTGKSCAPTIKNCLIRNNTPAGVYCTGLAAPIISDCTIKNNSSEYMSFGLRFYNAGEAKVLNNLIVNNDYGIHENTYYQLTIRNNTISRNNLI